MPKPTLRQRLLRGEWHIDVQAQTNVPIDVGGRIGFELPGRVRWSLSLGTLPGTYVDAINAVAVSAGGYDESMATLVRQALSSSFVARTHLGWRPFRRRGFYLEVGYGFVALGGNAAGGDVIAAATGIEPPFFALDAHREYALRSVLHMVDAELGWQWLLWNQRIVLRAAIGFAGTVAARSTISPRFEPREPELVDLFTHRGAAAIDAIYLDYAMTPVFTLAAGYRFF